VGRVNGSVAPRPPREPDGVDVGVEAPSCYWNSALTRTQLPRRATTFFIVQCVPGNTRLVGLLLRAGARADYVTDLEETVFYALPSRPEEREAMTSILESHGIRRKGA